MVRLFISLLFGLLLAFPAGAQETGAGAPRAKAGEADSTKVATNGNRQVFTIVEEMPQFPGGTKELLKFISHEIHYPSSTGDGIQGRVLVQFIVNENGSLSDIEVRKGVDSSLDKEAVRVVKAMPQWIPGKQDGVHVAVKYTLPVIFNPR